MKYLVLAALMSLAACAPQNVPRERGRIAPAANPGQVIATERAFARMAVEKGTWTAFRHYATKDAQWPAPGSSPGLVNVQQSLKGTPDPAQPVIWGPDAAWSSCDGSFAVTTGEAVFPGGRKSRFVTVWQRQDDGEYRWVLEQGFASPGGATDPDTIPARVAECPRQRSRPLARVRRGEAWGDSASDDSTLQWATDIADCTRTASVWIATGEPGKMEEVLRKADPPSGGCAG